jgi:hypothetical protein
MKKIIIATALLFPYFSIAQTLTIKSTEQLVTTDTPVVFAYNKTKKQLERINLANKENSTLSIPENAIGFDVATLANVSGKHALILTNDGIYVGQTSKTKPILPINSLFSHLQVENFEKINLVIDANTDGLSDILLPDLNKSTLYIQNSEGQFNAHTFQRPAVFDGEFTRTGLNLEMNISSQPIVNDYNHDGLNDLLFLNKQGGEVLYANEHGYETTTTPINFAIKLDELSNGETRKITQILDVNNDGFIDFTTKQYLPAKGMDSLDIKMKHNLYLGTQGGFITPPITLFDTQGPSELILKNDFNNDGLIDLQKMEFDVGLGTIASMAMGGGSTDVDIEMSIFKQQANGAFNEKPNRELDLEMEISMDGGSASPALYLGDLDGDNKTDAVYKYNKKTLYIYYGEDNNLLSKERTKVKLALPKHNQDILLVDVNQDGKQDLVFKFTDADGSSKITSRISE